MSILIEPGYGFIGETPIVIDGKIELTNEQIWGSAEYIFNPPFDAPIKPTPSLLFSEKGGLASQREIDAFLAKVKFNTVLARVAILRSGGYKYYLGGKFCEQNPYIVQTQLTGQFINVEDTTILQVTPPIKGGYAWLSNYRTSNTNILASYPDIISALHFKLQAEVYQNTLLILHAWMGTPPLNLTLKIPDIHNFDIALHGQCGTNWGNNIYTEVFSNYDPNTGVYTSHEGGLNYAQSYIPQYN